MGLKEPGLRGSLRNVSVGIDAIPDIVVDDFESGDLTHWSGETDKYVVDDSDPVKEGTFSCKNIGDDDGNVYIGSAEGKDGVPQVGIPHRIYIHPGTSGNSITTVFFGSDTIDDRGTGYGVRLSSDANEVRLERWDDGSVTVLGTDSSIGTIDDSWFEVIILHEENGDFTVWVFDESGTERTDDGLIENDSTYITDGTYDNSIVTLEDGRGEGDAFDDWRYTKAPE